MDTSKAKAPNIFKETVSSKLKKSKSTSKNSEVENIDKDEEWLEEYYLRKYGPHY